MYLYIAGHQLRKSINRTKKTIIGGPQAWVIFKDMRMSFWLYNFRAVKAPASGNSYLWGFFFPLHCVWKDIFQTKYKNHSKKSQVPAMKLNKMVQKSFTNWKIVTVCLY